MMGSPFGAKVIEKGKEVFKDVKDKVTATIGEEDENVKVEAVIDEEEEVVKGTDTTGETKQDEL